MEWVLRALPWLLFTTSVAGRSQCLSLTSNFPGCVAGCITSGASSIGCTNTLDLSCQCDPDSSAAIQAYAAECATAACNGNAADILDGLEAGTSVCNCVASAASEALQLAPFTESYESGSTGNPQVGCDGNNDDGKLPPLPPPPSYSPPLSREWPPWSSSTHSSYSYDSADAVSPSGSYGDGQYVGLCEKTKVITVVHTKTTVSSWEPPAWTPSPLSSSTWSSIEGPFESEGGFPPYDTPTPFEDGAESQPLTLEEEQCFVGELSALPSCASACYRDVARSVGCAADYQCYCQQASGASFDYYFGDCLSLACDSEGYTVTNQFLSRACNCLSESDIEDDKDASKRQAPEDNKILGRDTPQDASPSCVQEDLLLAAENCTSLAEKVMPTCAQECYLSMAPDVGCKDLDFSCQCNEETQAKLSTMMMPCVLSACNFADLPSVIAGGSSVCSCASATGGGQAWEHQKKARAPTPTPAPAQAAPGSEPEKMGPPTTTICEEVMVQTENCATHRPTFAPCGRDCLSPVVPQAGCEIDDFQCQCAPDKQAGLSSLVRPCVEESCQDPSHPVNWDAAAMCSCASRGSTSTTCYGTTVTVGTISVSTSTRSSTEDDEETGGPQGAAGRYGVGIIVGVATVVFAAALAL